MNVKHTFKLKNTIQLQGCIVLDFQGLNQNLNFKTLLIVT